MKLIEHKRLTGERALFMGQDLEIRNCIFDDGESPLKESKNIRAYDTTFQWKYPFWYANNIEVENCSFLEMARAGIWYTNNISVKDSVIEAPKEFRRCDGVTLTNVDFFNAAETLWNCRNVTMTNVAAKGDYFAMNCSNMKIDNLRLNGNYSFDGCENIEICNSKLLSKDAFWNSNNITVKNCYITGEYLGWNSENLTLENCVIESLQGMCYIKNLKMKNCRLINTTLAFEYSTVEADIEGSITSVFNPISGTITADSIEELIMEEDKIDPTKTKITLRG